MRLATPMLVALLANAAAASDLAFNAYIGVPLGGGSPFFGVGAELGGAPAPHSGHDVAHTPRMAIDLRYRAQAGPVFLVNGLPVRHPRVLHASADGEPKGAKNDIDWYAIAGIAVGIGLIAAIAISDDASIKVCSGSNCPPARPPPAKKATPE